MKTVREAFITVAQFAGILLVGTSIVIGTSWITNWLKKPDIIEKVIEKPVIQEVVLRAPVCDGGYAEFQRLLASGQSLQLIHNESMFARAGRFINPKDVVVQRSGTGEVACGYLYVRTRKDGRALEEKYDSVYINPQGFGGHILAKKGNVEISDPTPNKTEYLLPLNSISYVPNIPYDPNAQNYKIVNWVNVLNASNETTFSIALSTLHEQGMIENISIIYKCWDPTDGKETRACQLSAQE